MTTCGVSWWTASPSLTSPSLPWPARLGLVSHVSLQSFSLFSLFCSATPWYFFHDCTTFQHKVIEDEKQTFLFKRHICTIDSSKVSTVTIVCCWSAVKVELYTEHLGTLLSTPRADPQITVIPLEWIDFSVKFWRFKFWCVQAFGWCYQTVKSNAELWVNFYTRNTLETSTDCRAFWCRSIDPLLQ